MKNTVILTLALFSVLLSSCSEPTDAELSVSADGSGHMQLRPPQLLINSRMIGQESLFAEVSISYSDVSTTFNAENEANTDRWNAQLQVPTQTAFTITVTWFDRIDQQRLNLVTASNDFQPINFPGEVTINRDFSNYDSDNFDADSDSFVNLTERLNGTSPFEFNASLPSNDPVTNEPAIFFQVNPRGTYLFVESDCFNEQADEPTRISLNDMGVTAGSTFTMQRTGSYQPGVGEEFKDDAPELGAVFVGPSGFLAPAAGSTATAFTTRATACSEILTDIAEDFNLRDPAVVTVPPGATEIWLTPNDSFWVDNFDPDGDFGVNVTVQSVSQAPSSDVSSGSNQSSTPVAEFNNTRPNGVWDVLSYDADEGTTTSGTVVITSTSLVEYYDFDGGFDCNLAYTTKYDNDWDVEHESFPTGWSATLTPTEIADQILFAFFDPDVTPRGTATLQYKGEVTTSTIADLDAQTCGVEENS